MWVKTGEWDLPYLRLCDVHVAPGNHTGGTQSGGFTDSVDQVQLCRIKDEVSVLYLQ